MIGGDFSFLKPILQILNFQIQYLLFSFPILIDSFQVFIEFFNMLFQDTLNFTEYLTFDRLELNVHLNKNNSIMIRRVISMNMSYIESKKYCRQPKYHSKQTESHVPEVQCKLLNHIIYSAQPNNLTHIIDSIDNFCQQNWMMNIGPEKGTIIDDFMTNKPVNKVLQIGGYCGYSALRFARAFPQAHILSIQISDKFAQISKQIMAHAGVADRVRVHTGNANTSKEIIQTYGNFDMVFLDHQKDLYLPDLFLIEKYGVLRKGSIVIGDNIIYPGAPDYLEWFKKNDGYKSLLEHSYDAYSDIPDAVLLSEKLDE